MSHVMEKIGIGELRSNPVADQCLKCFALYIIGLPRLRHLVNVYTSSSNRNRYV